MFNFAKKQPKEEDVILSLLKEEARKHFISLQDNELQNLAKEIVAFAHEPHPPQLEIIAKYGPMIVIPMLVGQALYWAGADGRESVISLFGEVEKPILKELIEFMGKFATDERFIHARNTAFWAIGERASSGIEDIDTALEFLKTLLRNHTSSRIGIFTSDDIGHFIDLLTKYKRTKFKFSIGDSVQGVSQGFVGKIGVITARTPFDKYYDKFSFSDNEGHNTYRVKFSEGSHILKEYELKKA